MDETIESLKLELEYKDNSNAVKDVRKLTSSLTKLQNISENMTGLTKVTTQLRNLSKVSLAKLNSQLDKFNKNIGAIGKVKKAVDDVKKSTTKLETEVVPDSSATTGAGITPTTTSGEISEEIEADTKETTELATAFDRLKEVMGNVTTRMSILKDSQDKLKSTLNDKKSYGDMPEYQEAKISFTDSVFESQQLQTVLSELKTKYEELVNSPNPKLDEIRKLSALIQDLNKDCEKLNDSIGGATKSISKLGTEGHKTNKKYSGLLKSLGRIAVYRAIRAVLSAITNAIKTGVQNVAQYSQEVNTALSQLKAVGTMVSNSLGAMVGEVLVLLTPAITTLAQGLIKVINVFNQLFATLRGKDTFIKAKENVEDYAESIKKAKSVSFGFDELNVLGNETDTSNMFETVEIQADKLDYTKGVLGSILSIVGGIAVKAGMTFGKFSKISLIVIAILAAIRSIFKAYKENEQVQSSVKAIWGVLKNVLTTLNNLCDKIIEIAYNILDALQPVIEQCLLLITSVLDVVLPIIQKILEAVIELLDNIWDKCGDSLTRVFQAVADVVGAVIKVVESIKEPLGRIIDVALELILSVVDAVLPLIDLILDLVAIILDVVSPVLEALAPLIEVVITLIAQILEIIEPIIEYILAIVMPVVSGILDFVITALKPVLEFVGNFVNGIIRIIKGIVEFLSGIFSLDLEKSLGGLKNIFGGAFDAISSIINGVKNVILGIVDGIKNLIGWVKKIPEAVGNVTSKISDSVSGAFSSAGEWISNTASNVWSGVKSTASKAWSGVKSFFGFADGGFPEIGQMFLAREAGPELVGTIGGRTAVANNDQIVEGIYQGVLQAMQDSNGNSSAPTYIKVYLDSKEIAAKVEKRQSEKGASIYKGGVLIGSY